MPSRGTRLSEACFARALVAERRLVQARLGVLLRGEAGVPARLRRAMAHTLLGGGKRVRPLLLLWCWDACRAGTRRTPPVSRRGALDAACAVEMIHAYSLIHDDLPAMDDDALRRGRPTCHVVFGEATAILAGDALQALAFATLAGLGPAGAGATALVARAAGPGGMAGGQQEDLDGQGRRPRPARIRRIHALKTGALLAAALQTGATLAGATPRRVAALGAAGTRLGLAFQAADDLLDATAAARVVGKGVRKDDAAGKLTWVRLVGVDEARRKAARVGRAGQALLAAALPPSVAAERLLTLTATLWERDR